MTSRPDLDSIRTQGILSGLAGFPFLFVCGLGWLIAATLTYWLPGEVAPWAYPAMGGVAVPIAIALEKRLGLAPAPDPDPLLPLTLQLLFVQIIAFPAIVLVWDSKPALMPVAFAAVVGAHFLPFQWVYRTPIYAVLSVWVAVGPFVLAVIVGEAALHYTGYFVGASLLVAAALVRRHAKATWATSQQPPSAQ